MLEEYGLNNIFDMSIQTFFKKLPYYIFKKNVQFIKFIKWKTGLYDLDPVYFYTFHKCASTLFSSYLLKNVSGLYNIDYALSIFNGKIFKNYELNKMGTIYGPIRLSTPFGVPDFEYIKITSSVDFIHDKKAIFFVRDPRDIIVSSYYSFGYTHGFSRVDQIKEFQLKQMKYIQQLSLDEYAINYAPVMRGYFGIMIDLIRNCEHGILIKYEDMIYNWDSFKDNITKYLNLKDRVLNNTHYMSRPKKNEDTSSHIRSGKPMGFMNKLQSNTIDIINNIMLDELMYFDYTI